MSNWQLWKRLNVEVDDIASWTLYLWCRETSRHQTVWQVTPEEREPRHWNGADSAYQAVNDWMYGEHSYGV